MRENLIEAQLIKRVAECGGITRKVKFEGRRGAPDRVVMLPGSIIFWVECKAPGEKPEDHQEREHKRMRAMGQSVVVIDSYAAIEELLA